jgi:hypothetical protein
VKKKGLRLRLEKAAADLSPLNIKVNVPVRILSVCVGGGGGGDEQLVIIMNECMSQRLQPTRTDFVKSYII